MSDTRLTDPEGLGGFAPGWEMNDYVIGSRLGAPSDEGVVYQTSYKQILDRAVKFVPATFNPVALQNEVRLLALVRHSHIVKILDFAMGRPAPPRGAHLFPPAQGNLFPAPGVNVPYVAMDHIAGRSLSWAGITEERALDVLVQLLDAVVYLHERGILHMDLKPTNILIENSSGNVVVIDLGFSLVADPALLQSAFGPVASDLATNMVHVSGTQLYTHPDRRKFLGTEIPRDQLRADWFPHHDLYAISVMIGELLLAVMNLKPTARRGLELVRALIDRPGCTADVVRSAIRKLQPGYLAPLGVRELSPVLDEGGKHLVLSERTVEVTDELLAVINHPVVQRLRHIPQLEFASLVYPDARHTRLAHSLATMHACRVALNHMLGDVRLRLELEPADIQAALVFALLHDIGHYPLSHMFEDFHGQGAAGDTVRDDDELFWPVVEGRSGPPTDAVAQAVRAAQADIVPLGNTLVERFGVRVVDAMRSIGRSARGGAPSKPMHRVLAGLLSSVVDVDKIAYLAHDSAMSGVPYGRGIDVEIFASAIRWPDMPNTDDTTPLIALDEKGLAAAEAIVCARYWMLSRVYWHHTNRAVMAAFKFTIGELMEIGALSFANYLHQSFWLSDVEAMRMIADWYDRARPIDTVNPVTALLGGGRGIYKRLVTVSARDEAALYARLTDAANAEPRFAAVARDVVARYTKAPPGSVVVDIPRKRRDILELERIRIVNDDRAAGDRGTRDESLRDASQLIRNWQDEFLDNVKKCRVLVTPEIAETLQAAGTLERVRRDVREALTGA